MNDATTYDKMLVPDRTSKCLNCGKPGTVHVDDKCPFEASQFEASEHHVPIRYVKSLLDWGSNTPGATTGTAWVKTWKP